MFAALALDIGKPYLHKQLCFREESRTESHISKLIKSSRVQIFNIKRLKKDSCQNKKISEIAILSWCENLRSWRLHEFMNSFIHSFIHSMLMSFLLANKTPQKNPEFLWNLGANHGIHRAFNAVCKNIGTSWRSVLRKTSGDVNILPSWWLNHPSEKYARQNGNHLPQFSVWQPKNCGLPFCDSFPFVWQRKGPTFLGAKMQAFGSGRRTACKPFNNQGSTGSLKMSLITWPTQVGRKKLSLNLMAIRSEKSQGRKT